MEHRLDLKRVNILLIVSFIGITCVVIVTGLLNAAGKISSGTFQLWQLGPIYPEKIACTMISHACIIVFACMAFLYNQIRKRKIDKYLSSMIFYTAIYQVIARISEILYTNSESDLQYFVSVSMKFYLPLDILSVIFFTLVAFDVFLLSGVEKASKNIPANLLLFIGIGGTIIGIVITTFPFYHEALTFRIVFSMASVALYGIIIILVAYTSFKIFKLWASTKHDNAILAMGLQLIFSTAALLFFILVEGGEVLPFNSSQLFIFRSIKNVLFLLIALLLYPAFIRPAKQKLLKS